MLRSWQGNPAVTTKLLLQYAEAKRVNLAEPNGLPSESAGGNGESSDPAE
jgi:hypothetical protein